MLLDALSDSAQRQFKRVLQTAEEATTSNSVLFRSGFADLALACKDYRLPAWASKGVPKRFRGPVKPSLGEPHHTSFRASVSDALPTKESLETQAQVAHKRHALKHWLAHSLKPKGPGCNDRGKVERVVNVLTSLPFLFVGAKILRERRSEESKAFGSSMLAVGAAAVSYHATSGQLRTVLRKLDYWTISASSMLMTRALLPEQNSMRRASNAAGLLLPFQPSIVSIANAGIMEVEYAKKARRSRKLAQLHRQHVLATLIGGACFFGEDAAIAKGIWLMHPIWHCLACYGVWSTNHLLQHNEQAKAQRL